MNRPTGFSLIELLVVISIIAILASMLLPAIGLVRQAAQTAGCATNQRQIAMAVVAYAGEQNGVLPYSFGPVPSAPSSNVFYYHTERLGQYLEIESPGSGAISGFKGAWKVLRCASNTQSPGGPGYGLNHRYCCDSTWGSPPTYPPRPISQIPAGEAVIVADNAGDGRMTVYTPLLLFGGGNIDQTSGWISGHPELQPFLPVLRHRGGCNLGFLDGHVRWSPNLAIEDQAKTVVLR